MFFPSMRTVKMAVLINLSQRYHPKHNIIITIKATQIKKTKT